MSAEFNPKLHIVDQSDGGLWARVSPTGVVEFLDLDAARRVAANPELEGTSKAMAALVVAAWERGRESWTAANGSYRLSKRSIEPGAQAPADKIDFMLSPYDKPNGGRGDDPAEANFTARVHGRKINDEISLPSAVVTSDGAQEHQDGDPSSGWVGWEYFYGEKLRLDGKFTADELEEIAALMRQGGPAKEG